MKISAAHIYGYGKFADKDFVFKEGFNIFLGKNEAGKSTLMSFIKAMLYGQKKERESKEGQLPESKKYKPWNTDKYGGYLKVETDTGEVLRIERDFSDRSFKVFDVNNEDISNRFSMDKDSGMPGQDLLGMDMECFANSSFICQDKSILYSEDKEHIAEKLANINESAEESVSVKNACKSIKDKLTELGNDRTSKKPYNMLLEDIRNEEDIQTKMQESNEICLAYLSERDDLVRKIGILKNEEKMSERKEILDKSLSGKSKYDGYLKEKENINKRISDTDEKKIEKESKALNEELSKHDDLDKEIDSCKNKSKKYKSIMITIIIISLLVIASTVYLMLEINILYATLFILPVAALFTFLLFKKRVSTLNVQLHDIEKLIIRQKEMDELVKKAEQDRSNRILIRTYDGLMQDILSEEDVLDYKALNEKIDLLRSEKIMTVRSREDCLSDIQNSRERLAIVQAEISKYMNSNEVIAEHEEKLAELKEKMAGLERKKEALAIAYDCILQASKKMQEYVIPKMNEEMSVYLEKITAGKHTNIKTGQKMELNTEYTDKVHSIYEFSDGTIRQMYLAFRLAAGKTFSQKKSSPIFMDEALVYYDSQRKKSTLDFLYGLSENTQIIFFVTGIEDEFIKDKNISIYQFD
ncbi:MAG: AAA family ATPase [Clostridia bacterium]